MTTTQPRSIRFGVLGLLAAGFVAVSLLATEGSTNQSLTVDTGTRVAPTAAPVPESAALLLMGTGLLVVAGGLRRRHDKGKLAQLTDAR